MKPELWINNWGTASMNRHCAVAAANEIRAAVEQLLPDPAQRKAAADEMLRWYQNHAPPEDGPRDAAPPAHSPRSEPARKPSPEGDPGF